MRKYLNCIWVILLLAAVLTACGKKECSHKNQETVGAVPATCTAKGYTGETKCLDCGEVIQAGSEVAVLEHKAVVEGAVPATCLEGGKTGVSVCELCKAVLHENTDIPATGHTNNVVNKTDATCTEDGYSGDTVCSTCNAVIEKGSVVPAAHNPVTKGYKAATCTSEGATGDTSCADCGKVLESNKTIAKTAHTVTLKNKKEATCTSSGYSGDEYCSVCGEKLKTGSTVAKLEHNPTTKNAKAATCGEAGYSGDIYCSYCKVTISTGYVLPALGEHKLTRMHFVPASTTKEGYSGDLTCMLCNTVFEKGHVTAKLPILPEYTCYTEMEQNIFKEFNEIRAEHGLGSLQYDSTLQPAVYNRVREYIYMYVQGNNANNFGPHQRPDGANFTVAMAELGFRYSLAGEIIAGSFSGDLVATWMRSEPHKASILDSRFSHVAVSVVYYEDMYYSVAIFHNNTSSVISE